MRSDRRGVALVLTLWVLAAMIVLAAGLGAMVRTDTQVSRNYANTIRCRWAARAGQNRAVVEAERLAGQPVLYFEGPRLVLSSVEEQAQLGDAAYDVEMEDEAGKININTASRSVLQGLFGSRDIADCVMDWRDKNDRPEPLGAETQYYAGQLTGYKAKNAPFDTVRELLLVKGITREMLEAPATDDGRTLQDLLTVYSRDTNLSADGKQRVDITKVGKDKLKTEFRGVLNDQDIDAIIKYRDGDRRKPTTRIGSDIPTVPDTRRSGRRFRNTGDIVRVQGLARRKIARIFDRLTVSDETIIPGLVNINTAPEAVLAALPGMDEDAAREIVEYRDRNGAFSDVGALLNTGINNRAFSRCAHLLTARSKVFTIRSTGRLVRERTSNTIVCVADVTEGRSGQIRYWRE